MARIRSSGEDIMVVQCPVRCLGIVHHDRSCMLEQWATIQRVNPGLDPPLIHTPLILFCPALSALRIHISLALVARCLLPESYTEALLKCIVAVLAHIRRCFVGIGVITV